jgi:hypothetical protein
MAIFQRKSTGWRIEDTAETIPERRAFASLDQVFALEGELVASDRLSQVLRCNVAGSTYYVKRYVGAGKGLRQLFGRSRLRAEWENIKLFESLDVPTPTVVAYGEERRCMMFRRGALVLAELPGTTNLIGLCDREPARLKDSRWVREVGDQVAVHLRRLHEHRFTHNDLHWRNILVRAQGYPKVYFIDCPFGRHWFGPFLSFRIIKDLAHLDKEASPRLSRPARLRFYARYTGRPRLSAADKRTIRAVLRRNGLDRRSGYSG